MAWWEIMFSAIGGLTAIAAAGIAIGALVYKHGKWVGAVNSDRDSFKAFMQDVSKKLDKIFERLPPPPTVVPGSPLQLTEFGTEISGKLGAKDWALKQAMALSDKVEGKEPYEVDDLCGEHVQVQFDLEGELHALIRSGAYENGITVSSVQEVFVIELREALFDLMGVAR